MVALDFFLLGSSPHIYFDAKLKSSPKKKERNPRFLNCSFSDPGEMFTHSIRTNKEHRVRNVPQGTDFATKIFAVSEHIVIANVYNYRRDFVYRLLHSSKFMKLTVRPCTTKQTKKLIPSGTFFKLIEEDKTIATLP